MGLDILQTLTTTRSPSVQLVPIALLHELLVKEQVLALVALTSLLLARSAACHVLLALNARRLEQLLHVAAPRVIIVLDQRVHLQLWS